MSACGPPPGSDSRQNLCEDDDRYSRRDYDRLFSKWLNSYTRTVHVSRIRNVQTSVCRSIYKRRKRVAVRRSSGNRPAESVNAIFVINSVQVEWSVLRREPRKNTTETKRPPSPERRNRQKKIGRHRVGLLLFVRFERRRYRNG